MTYETIKKMRVFISSLFFTFSAIVHASEEHQPINPTPNQASQEAQSDFRISGYLETYYLHDFNHPTGDVRPGFTYSHNVTDKPSINELHPKI